VLGANVEEAALQSPHLIKVNEAGSDDALRDAIIGRIAGFTVIGNVNSVDPDFAVAFHPTAFALGNVAPVVPDGAKAGATQTFDSLAMRWIRDYDSDYLRDRSVYSAFAGASSSRTAAIMSDVEDANFGDLTDKNVRAVEIVAAWLPGPRCRRRGHDRGLNTQSLIDGVPLSPLGGYRMAHYLRACILREPLGIDPVGPYGMALLADETKCEVGRLGVDVYGTLLAGMNRGAAKTYSASSSTRPFARSSTPAANAQAADPAHGWSSPPTQPTSPLRATMASTA
jgi:hypothetical protein